MLVMSTTFPRWEGDVDPPFVYELSKRLLSQFDVSVHTPHTPGSKKREIVDGISVHRFRYFFSFGEKLAGSVGILPTLKRNKLYYAVVPFFLVSQFLSLFILVKKEQPDVIHAHWLVPQGFIAVLVKYFFKKPVVVTAHGGDVFALNGRLCRAIKRLTLDQANSVTVVSRAIADALYGYNKECFNLDVIPMGVDSELFHPDKVTTEIREKHCIQGPLLLFVGRLTEKKGVGYLVDSMPTVLDRYPKAKLLIIGDGELGDELKSQVKSLGINECIEFVGGVKNIDLPSYYSSADIFIGPSVRVDSGDTEGFGLTFVEAAMSGCLLIGTDVGGIRDIILEGETGFIVKEKDSGSLADTIIYSLNNPGIVESLKMKSKKFCIENYEWKIVADKYCSVLSKVLPAS